MILLYVPGFAIDPEHPDYERPIGHECRDMLWGNLRANGVGFGEELMPWEWDCRRGREGLDEEIEEIYRWEADCAIQAEINAERAHFGGGGCY